MGVKWGTVYGEVGRGLGVVGGCAFECVAEGEKELAVKVVEECGKFGVCRFVGEDVVYDFGGDGEAVGEWIGGSQVEVDFAIVEYVFDEVVGAFATYIVEVLGGEPKAGAHREGEWAAGVNDQLGCHACRECVPWDVPVVGCAVDGGGVKGGVVVAVCEGPFGSEVGAGAVAGFVGAADAGIEA